MYYVIEKGKHLILNEVLGDSDKGHAIRWANKLATRNGKAYIVVELSTVYTADIMPSAAELMNEPK